MRILTAAFPLLLLAACTPHQAERPAGSPPPATAELATAAAAKPAPPGMLVRLPSAPLAGTNLARGRRCISSAKPNYGLCSDDLSKLTDGDFSQGWFWTDLATVGWRFKKRIVLTIDLGVVQPVDTISFNTCGNRDTGARAGVDLPDAWFLVSADGENYHRVASFHGKTLPDLPDTYVRRFRADDLGVAARHLAIVVIPTGMFAFCDEIEVISGGAGRAPAGQPLRLDRMAQLQSEDRTTAALHATVERNLAEAGKQDRLPALAGRPDADWRVTNAGLAAERFPGQELIAWRRDIWQDYSRDALPPADAEPPSNLHLAMGSAEAESAGFALTNAASKPIRIRATVSELIGSGGKLPPATVRIDSFCDALDGIHRPDALPLLDDEGADIEPGATRQIWIGVRTAGQAAGIYAGRLTVTSPAGNREIPLSVEVLPVALPRPLPLDTLVWSYLYLPLIKTDTAAALRDLADHHITTTALEASTLPHFTVAADGNILKADYARFDEAIRGFSAVGIRHFIFFSYFGDGGGLKSPLGCNVAMPKGMAIGDPAWKAAMTAVVRAWVRRCQELGLDFADFAFYPFDEPSDGLLKVGAPVYAAIRAAEPRARMFMTVVNDATPSVMSQLAPQVDVWCHHLYRDFTFIPDKLAFYQERMHTGSSLWLYNAQEPDKSFHPLGHYRRLFWKAWEVGATGVGVWNYADLGWEPGASAWTDLDGKREDFTLVYDAATAPAGVSRQEAQIPSRRWEAFRDGIEDYCYLWMVRRAAQAARTQGRPDIDAETVLAEASTLVAAEPASAEIYATVHLRLLRLLARIGNPRP